MFSNDLSIYDVNSCSSIELFFIFSVSKAAKKPRDLRFIISEKEYSLEFKKIIKQNKFDHIAAMISFIWAKEKFNIDFIF